jgi:uncharacterized phage protein (TIGR01671 family)
MSKRKILFRGKQIVCREWVYGSLVILKLEEEDVYRISDFAGDSILRVIPETVGQYTGLKDENGAKIFEGDIARYSNGETYEVFFSTGANSPERAGFCLRDNRGYLYDYCWVRRTYSFLEVIGNIYDNSEIFKVEK